MAIPPLTAHGLLPPGVHDATLDEVASTFGSSTPRRAALATSLRAFVDLARGFGLFTKVFVDGSFTTDADPPGDVDLVLQIPGPKMRDLHAHPQWTELDRASVKAKYEVDLLIEPTENGNAFMVGLFMTLKPKDLLARKVPASHRRGILRVVL